MVLLSAPVSAGEDGQITTPATNLSLTADVKSRYSVISRDFFSFFSFRLLLFVVFAEEKCQLVI